MPFELLSTRQSRLSSPAAELDTYRLRLNRAAAQLLGDTHYVRVLTDRETGAIALESVSEAGAGVYALAGKPGYARAVGTGRIAAAVHITRRRLPNWPFPVEDIWSYTCRLDGARLICERDPSGDRNCYGSMDAPVEDGD